MKIFCKVKPKSNTAAKAMEQPVVIISSSEDEAECTDKKVTSKKKSSTNFNSKNKEVNVLSYLKSPLIDEPNKDTNELFKQFYNLCEENILSTDQKGVAILDYLQRKHDKTKTTDSRDYRKAIVSASKQICERKESIYSAICDVVTLLKKLPTKRKISTSSAVSEEPVVKVSRCSDTIHKNNEAGDDNAESSSSNQQKINNEKLERKIQKYEIYLKSLNKEINKFEKMELSLDEMEDNNSAYMQKCRLEKRATQVFKRICQLKNQSESTGRISEKKIRVSTSRFHEINHIVQKFLNKKKDLVLQFPDFTDIHELIEKASKKSSLNLSPTEIKVEAQAVFRDVGQMMQKRRVKDFIYEFGNFNNNAAELPPDPADNDEELAKKLTVNKKRFQESTKEIVEMYANIQTQHEKSLLLSKEESQDMETHTYDESVAAPSNEKSEDSDVDSDVVIVED